MSATRRRSGVAGVKLRLTRSGAAGAQLGVDPRGSVRAPAVAMDEPDEVAERPVGLRPRGRRSTSPAVEAALRDLEHPAQGADAVVGLLRLDERVDHRRGRRFSSLAKKAAASMRRHILSS